MNFQSLVELAPWTTIAQICNLLIQIVLFKKFLFQPIKNIIAKRQAEVDGLYDEAGKAKADAEEDVYKRQFLDKAKRYTDIQALTPALLRLFIQKIVVHEKEVNWSKHAPQTVEIHYADIGCMENNHAAEAELDAKIPLV